MAGLGGAATLGAVKRALTATLSKAGISEATLEARMLMGAACGYESAQLIAHSQDVIDPQAFEALQGFETRRLSGEPISAILGYRDFWKDRFIVTDDVLTPRPETEGIIDAAVHLYSDQQSPCDARVPTRILDLGTGSGAVLLSLLREFPKAQGLGIDISEAALSVARRNSKALDLPAIFQSGSWLSGLTQSFDLIVSNPPYISTQALQGLETEVIQHDPHIALHGGDDGLDPYRAILAGISARDKVVLMSGGWLIFETGFDQAQSVAQMMTEAGLKAVHIYTDLSGIERIICGQKADEYRFPSN